jgi:hypothetical protein
MAADEQVWVGIDAYDGQYEVSADGQVRSLKRRTPRVLKQHMVRGYQCVNLCMPKQRQIKWRVHRLVALTLLPAADDERRTLVDHVDGNRLNNHVANLRWVTARENALNRCAVGGTSIVKGVARHKATGKWEAYITDHGQRHYLGLFTAEARAVKARLGAEKRLHGEYARVQ